MAKLRLIFGICKIKSGNRVFSPEKDENVVVRKKIGNAQCWCVPDFVCRNYNCFYSASIVNVPSAATSNPIS